ncbi:alginate lyase family protein [Mariniflexile sp.]|uniref:alginate lyase family protein n=1 Tax=Mariniflexile sp. TaxID=1979402 RepID=UPI0040476F99
MITDVCKTGSIILVFFIAMHGKANTGLMQAKKIDNNHDTKKVNTQKTLSLLDYDQLMEVKKNLKSSKYASSYKNLLNSADKALKKGPFSVVNKTQTPVSGDKHDYLSLGPYWWPDPDKADGLPWIRRDGEVNPLTRGDNVDEPRKDKMFDNVNKLSYAYFFTDDEKYAKKLIELLEVWFLNPETKMNPNLNFAQGIPGTNTGRGIGIIEFGGISNVINAIEILELNNTINESTSKALRNWMERYLDWLQTSENGVFEKNTKNNHATHYDVQVTSLLLFLNRRDEAKALLESVKTIRIQTQIEPDGKQPHELARTKSLSYSTMNLGGFLQLAYLGTKVNVDLWNYQAENGASIQKAFEFLKPYAAGEKEWEYEQIASLEKSLHSLKELFAKAGSIFNNENYCEIGKKEGSSLFYNCD